MKKYCDEPLDWMKSPIRIYTEDNSTKGDHDDLGDNDDTDDS